MFKVSAVKLRITATIRTVLKNYICLSIDVSTIPFTLKGTQLSSELSENSTENGSIKKKKGIITQEEPIEAFQIRLHGNLKIFLFYKFGCGVGYPILVHVGYLRIYQANIAKLSKVCLRVETLQLGEHLFQLLGQLTPGHLTDDFNSHGLFSLVASVQSYRNKMFKICTKETRALFYLLNYILPGACYLFIELANGTWISMYDL